jgi:import inner membrane translocase subunit TIM50
MFLTNAVESVDPGHQFFLNAFGKESMVWSDGRYIKDLTYLNRDPKHIIVVDHDIRNVSKHPQNVILLKDFDGNDNDQELNKLLPLLESNLILKYRLV